MIAPWWETGALSPPGVLVAGLFVGIAFGACLERAGLGSAKKLIGQFTLKDMAVFKVMFTAIVTAMLGVFWLSRVGVLDLDKVYLPETFVLPQLAGGVIFGVGFALAGLCPGTSCVAAATGRGDGLAVVLGMLAGVLATGLALPTFQEFFVSTAKGGFTLSQAFGVTDGAVVFAIVALALVGFAVTSRIERWASRTST
ncbi:MAG: DUF6691 family protein [bacterium]